MAVALGMLGAAAIGYLGSKQAAGAQRSAARNASQAQMQQYYDAVRRLQPYNQAGQGGLTNLSDLVHASPEQLASMYTQSPGYQWKLGQGEQAIMDQASAMGGINSGRTLKALAGYGQGLASQDFNQWLQNQYSMNMGLASMGEQAAGMSGQYGLKTGGEVGSNMLGAGNAAAAGYVGGANAATTPLNNYTNYALMQQMYGQPQPVSAPVSSGVSAGMGIGGLQGIGS